MVDFWLEKSQHKAARQLEEHDKRRLILVPKQGFYCILSRLSLQVSADSSQHVTESPDAAANAAELSGKTASKGMI